MENGKRFERKPNFDMQASLSRDGRYWIIKRIETWILPRKYLAVIEQNHGKDRSQKGLDAVAVPAVDSSKKKGKRNADSDGQGN